MSSQTNNSFVRKPASSEQCIYEGGQIYEIASRDLLNNEVAITQLLNDFNKKVKEINEKEQVICELRSDVEHLKTTPFMAILSTVINLLGTLVAGVGMEQLKDSKGVLLICIGGVLVVVGSISTVLFPYAKVWFNRVSQEQ